MKQGPPSFIGPMPSQMRKSLLERVSRHPDPSHGYPSLWSAIFDPACPSRRFQSVRILLGLFCAFNSLSCSLFSDDLTSSFDHQDLVSKHTTLVSNIMVGIGSLLSLGAYLYLNLVQTHRVEVSGGADIPILFPPFTAFHQFILHPFDGEAILGLLGWILVLWS